MKWIGPRPTQDEIDEWDRDGTRYDLTGWPRLIKVLLVLAAILLGAIAGVFEEIGCALHRAVSALHRFGRSS